MALLNMNLADRFVPSTAIGTSNNPDDIQFLLYVGPRNKCEPMNIRFADNDVDLDMKKPLKVLIHGSSSHFHMEFPENIKTAYLDNPHKNDYNIIIVNWGKLAGPCLLPFNVRKRIQTVGKRVGDFLMWLADSKDLQLEDVHLVGHALGSHVSGLAAKVVNTAGKRLGRISALDPDDAGWITSLLSRRLEKNDADFVDGYHSNARNLAIASRAVGKTDFFINAQQKHWIAHRIFYQTILEGPEKNDVTHMTHAVSQSEALDDDAGSNFNRIIILGAGCQPSTRGRYGIEYPIGRAANANI